MSGRPIIGISAGRAGVPITEGLLESHYVGLGYVAAISAAGGIPVILPAVEGAERLIATEVIDLVDGVLLSGGNDLAPASYGGGGDRYADKIDLVRDWFEIALVQEARRLGRPVLGICRGQEVINVAYGGDIVDGVMHERAEPVDLPGLRGARAHTIDVLPDSRAAGALGAQVEAMCLHHQAPGRIGDGLVVSGRSADGVAEIIEDPDLPVVGVLWHPELALDRSELQIRLYEQLVSEAAHRRREVDPPPLTGTADR